LANITNLAIYAVIGYFLLKNKDKVGQFLTGLVPLPIGGGGGGTTTTAPSGGGKGGTSKGGGGGGVVSGGGGSFTGTHIYKTTGKKCSCTNEGEKSLSCHSGGGGVTVRGNCNNCSLDNYEATGILQFTGKCGCGGDEATIKHLGPSHSKGNCCWSISTVTQAGNVGFNQEGPHPDTTKPKPEKTLGNVGSLVGKKVGIKSVIWKGGSGWHQEVWVDASGSGSNWKKFGAKDFSSWGATKTTSTKAPNQQVEFRNDCSGAKWLSLDVSEIVPGGAAAGYARAIKVKAMRASIKRAYTTFNTLSDSEHDESPICPGDGGEYVIAQNGQIMCKDTHHGDV